MEVLIPSEKRYVKLKGNTAHIANGNVNDCCKKAEHLKLVNGEDNRTLIVWRCIICGRNHYVLKAEPGRVGIMGI